ncbi:MAG TPA: hypothetical protein VF268_16165 [Gammaproteobacteria bacterium]
MAGDSLTLSHRSRPALAALTLLQLGLLAGFVAAKLLTAPGVAPLKDVPPPVSAEDIRLLALGEAGLAAKLLEFWLLTFESQSGRIIKYESLDYDHLSGWLETIQQLDPLSNYPSLMASGVFIEVNDDRRARKMIDFVHRAFLMAPQHRWRWQARAVILAKYRLDDLELARRLARDLRIQAADHDIPGWARDMEVLILQEMGEFETARMLVGNLLNSGAVTDPDELRFLTTKLKELSGQPLHK